MWWTFFFEAVGVAASVRSFKLHFKIGDRLELEVLELLKLEGTQKKKNWVWGGSLFEFSFGAKEFNFGAKASILDESDILLDANMLQVQIR